MIAVIEFSLLLCLFSYSIMYAGPKQNATCQDAIHPHPEEGGDEWHHTVKMPSSFLAADFLPHRKYSKTCRFPVSAGSTYSFCACRAAMDAAAPGSRLVITEFEVHAVKLKLRAAASAVRERFEIRIETTLLFVIQQVFSITSGLACRCDRVCSLGAWPWA